MIRRSLALSLFLLASCGGEEPSVIEAKKAISDLLTDPQSAQWEDISPSGPCIRGRVNAKNQMGGYTGFSPFFYNVESKEAGIDPGKTSDAEFLIGMFDRHNAVMAFLNASTKCSELGTKFANEQLKKLQEANK